MQLQVRAEEGAAHDERVLHCELLNNVVPHARRSGRRQRQHRDAAEPTLQAREVSVRAPKVVPPFADAVGLVDGDQPEVHRLEQPADRRIESLGRGIEELVLASAQRRRATVPLLRRQRRIQERRADAHLVHRIDLVLHQRDEWRNHEREPAEDPRGNLVGKRLAGAGRHDTDAISARQQRIDDLLLARPVRGVAEYVPQHREGPVCTDRLRRLLDAHRDLPEHRQRSRREEFRRLAVQRPQRREPRFESRLGESRQRGRLGKDSVRRVCQLFDHFHPAPASASSWAVISYDRSRAA